MKKSFTKDHTFLVGIFFAALIAFCVIDIYIHKTYQPAYSEASVLEDTSLVGLHPHVSVQDMAPLQIPKQAHQRGSVVEVPILMYHHVGNMPLGIHDPVRSGLTVSPQDFAQQVAWVHSNGYTSISLNDLYNASQKKFTLPRKPIIFSFDDGYDDVFLNAIPILQKFGYTGSFGIITNFPGTQSGTNTYATWDVIAAAKQAGMEIVCHTENHFDGSSAKFTADYILENLNGCQQALQSHIGSDSVGPYLIYPYGHYTQLYIEQARKAGFVMALTVHEGKYLNLENLMELPRVRVNGGESIQEFQKKLLQ